jgi:hypothetical protein
MQAVLGSGKAQSSTVARAQGNPVWTITVLLKDNPALKTYLEVANKLLGAAECMGYNFSCVC